MEKERKNDRKIKILLVLPDAKMHKLVIGPFKRSLREAPLTLTTLAALIPDKENFDVKIVDGSIDPIPIDYPADLVAVSVLTGTACRAYKIADNFRQKNIPVVLGGVHVTILPEEARQHADSIIIGMAERSWPRLLSDFRDNKMQKVYCDDYPEDGILRDVPSPRIDLLRRSGYTVPDTVQATRGCKHSCDFCTVPVVWQKYFKRPIADVIRDIKNLPGHIIVFNDVSLIEDIEYAKELFTAMIPLKKKWGGLATTLVAKDEELLGLMRRSGCIYLLLGFESANQNSLRKIHKGFNRAEEYKITMSRLHYYGISVQGCFVFGFDEDDTSVFEHTIQMVSDLKIDIPRYSIYTPYPETHLFRRLEKEKRIISYNWNDYDTMHVVYMPKLMTPEELYDGFKLAYKETFKLPHILKRTLMHKQSISSVINFVGNLTYRIFVKRLYCDERFSKPYGTID